MSPGETRYCLAPVLITAYIGPAFEIRVYVQNAMRPRVAPRATSGGLIRMGRAVSTKGWGNAPHVRALRAPTSQSSSIVAPSLHPLRRGAPGEARASKCRATQASPFE